MIKSILSPSSKVVNFYQSLVDCENNIVSLESLARLKTKTGNIITPDFFVDIYNNTFPSLSLFTRVLNNALLDILSLNIDCNVSINVTHEDLSNPFFTKAFMLECERYKISPSRFTLEITEKGCFSNNKIFIENVIFLFEKGVRISLDDFGVGCSNFIKLLSFPISEVKLDREFSISDSLNSVKSSLVEVICELSHKLNFDVVAEGIEDKETFEYMSRLGVHYFQGYYIDIPRPLN